jgi:hypothetical protein
LKYSPQSSLENVEMMNGLLIRRDLFGMNVI